MSHPFRDRVANYFMAHPNQEVSNWTLMELGGSQAWRTRVSECRTQLGMAIPRPRIERDERGVATTWYRYNAPMLQPETLLDVAQPGTLDR